MEDLTCCELPCHYPREANKQTKSRESSPCTAPLIQRSLLVKKLAKWNACFSLISAIWNKVSEQTGFISLLCYYPRNWLKTSKNSILDGFCCYQDVWKKSLYVPKLWTLCEYFRFLEGSGAWLVQTNTASSSFSCPDLTCWLQQDVVVCSSMSGRVIIWLLLLGLLITVPVWLQFPPGEHLRPVIFFLEVVPFILILKREHGGWIHNVWFQWCQECFSYDTY